MPAHRILAQAIVAGPFTAGALRERMVRVLGTEEEWLDGLVSRLLARFSTRPRLAGMLTFLWKAPELPRPLRLANFLPPAPEATMRWAGPALATTAELATFLGLNPGELIWFTRLGRPEHYHVRDLPKRSGGTRRLAVPKRRLKTVQRLVLDKILAAVPVHPAAHGFCRGRSVRTYVEPHRKPKALLRMDLAEFFPSIRFPRVAAFFRTMGYPEAVADALAALCTYEGALPQGAPTSPALANAMAYRLDCRLAGLAASLGLAYTRYADDLAFSAARLHDSMLPHVAAIVMEEGFTPNYRKTRLMRPGERQHLAGLTLNEKPNLARAEYDTLKATLTNCVRLGPASQNREGQPAFRAHLAGRVAHAVSVNPERGKRLRAIFERIIWEV